MISTKLSREAYDGKISLGSPPADTAVEDSAINSQGNSAKERKWVSRRIGAARRLVDNFNTEEASYGPPYHKEYGGDLPDECNRIKADLLEIHYLLRNGADPNVGRRADHGLTPLHFAARFGNVILLKMLKRAGGDPNITSTLGLTSLSYTCALKLSVIPKGGDELEQMQVAAIKWLIHEGANPNHVDKAGFTPLSWACRSGVFPAVEVLVEAGADVLQRRPKLPRGSQVRLPKVDVLAVTVEKTIQRYVQAKVNIALQREAVQVKARLSAARQAIADRQDTRQCVTRQNKLARQSIELKMKRMKVNKAEQARNDRHAWLRRLKVSPGIWVKRESRQLEKAIVRDNKNKVLSTRWLAMTGKRLLRLEHGQRIGLGLDKGNDKQRRRERGQTNHAQEGEGNVAVARLNGLEEEESGDISNGNDSSGVGDNEDVG